MGIPELVVMGLTALLTVGIPAAIVVICILWMRSTRASQRRVDEQNERIIELLERIAGSYPERSEGSKAETRASASSSPVPAFDSSLRSE